METKNQTSIKEKILSIDNKISESVYKNYTFADWHKTLAEECQVYVLTEGYLAKRFDQINYQMCGKDIAKEIVTDNLYALLRFKYFKNRDNDTDDQIDKIVKSFTTNLKTTLLKVSFNQDEEFNCVKFLPDGCMAFRNGVFDFKENKWLFKYNKIKIEQLNNFLYLYDKSYIIMWYINLDFIPLDININEFDTSSLLDFLKEIDKINKNYCFELLYNMSHNLKHEFDIRKFEHLCEILGYTCLQRFSQHFVMFIGSGQNGKNSLFDGCFTPRLVPAPAANDLQSIEEDRFVTGSLENKSHNIFLETDPNVKTKSKMLKQLTGSMYQFIEAKGENKRSSLINCRYIFSGNDQDKIKWEDTTKGFIRRINLYEVYFTWDTKKRFLKEGDYYDTTFSEDLKEIKEDISNIVIFIYLGMFGIKLGTSNYVHNFKFHYNDWKLQYSDVNFDTKDRLERVTLENVYEWILLNQEKAKLLFYDLSGIVLSKSPLLKEMGFNFMDGEDYLKKFLTNYEQLNYFFLENDAYISLRALQEICGEALTSPTLFTQSVKKIYSIPSFLMKNSNKPFVRIRFVGERLNILN